LVENNMNFFDRFLWHFFKINLTNQNDRNAWYLVLEMFWASILGSIAVFNAAFAIRLGADNFQVGLLASIPALMAVLVSIPAGQFLQRRSRRTPWVYGSLLAHRSGYLLVALAPLLGFIGIEPGLLVVLILVGISAPAHFFNVGWIPLLADVVPENRRAAVFTARNIVNQATLSVMVFVCGQWLNRVVFPINYQAMYLIGFAASMLSMYYLFKMHVPDSPVVQPENAPKVRSVGDFLRKTREALTGQPAFLRITVNTLLHGFGVWMAGPLYALYFVRVLNANDAWLGLNGTVASVGTIAGYSLWRWLMTRWGESISLKRTIVLVGVYPVLVGLTPSLPLILIYGALNGLIIPGTNLAHFNTLLKVTPSEARPSYTAIYMTIMNIGATICPLISVALASLIGLEAMLIVAGLLSIIGSTSFWWWPVVQPQPPLQPAELPVPAD
jgi:MFS family permease